MKRQSPSDYMRCYHGFSVQAFGPTGLPMAGTVHVTRYQVAAPLERDRLIAAIKTVLKIKHTPPLHSNYDWFAFAPGDPIQTHEPFYWQSIRRAFGFKGSPGEMQAVLRLACRLGRIGTGKDVAGQPAAAPTLAAYAKQFFSLDCNGFVGNYWGLSPEVHQSNWAVITPTTEARVLKKTTGGDYWNGWGTAAVKTLDYIPLTPRRAADEACAGDVLIVHKDDTSWSHIALVDHVTWVDGNQVNWRVVEYGESTSESNFDTAADNHIKPFRTVKLVQGPHKKLGVGYQDGNKFKYLFAAPDSLFSPATLGRCGVTAI